MGLCSDSIVFINQQVQAVNLGQLVNKDHRDRQDLRGLPAQPALLVKQETLGSLEVLGHEEVPDHPDLMASQGRRVQMVPQDSRDQQVQQGQEAHRAPEVNLVPMVSQDLLATLGLRDSKEPEVIRVLKALLVLLGLQDLWALQGTKDQLVSKDSLVQTEAQVPQVRT